MPHFMSRLRLNVTWVYDNKDDKDEVARPFDDPAIKLTDRKEDSIPLGSHIHILCSHISRVDI